MDGWTLHAASAADAEFLYRVYASTRYEELAPTGWTIEQQEAFLRSQFAAQDAHYRQHYPAARFDIVHAWGERVGRLYVERRSDEIRVLDIALFPQFRRRGLGCALLVSLIDEASALGQRVSLYVERNNPALNLYRQLGFVPIDAHGIYLLMYRLPAMPIVAAEPEVTDSTVS
jgi:ribosomal protein S18 acetylase RimI-like enzyme